MVGASPIRQYLARPLSFEHLERRIALAGDGVVDDQAPCLLELSTQGDAARATRAINCFAFDLYEHIQHEQGNLFLSPLSIATALAMAYAGAAGQTAAEMEKVLHLGTEPGIHASFAALLASFDEPTGVSDGFELELANAIWPQSGLSLRDEFVRTIQTDYRGEAQSLDYSNPDQAKEVINSWVEQKTHGRIQDLIERLSPTTRMVLTNSIYFKALWGIQIDPTLTNTGVFYREDGHAVETSMMHTGLTVPYTELDGFQVLQMPLEGGRTSMVLILPQLNRTGDSNWDGLFNQLDIVEVLQAGKYLTEEPATFEEGDWNGDQVFNQLDLIAALQTGAYLHRPVAANELTPELLVKVNAWLESPRDPVFLEVFLPKFQTTVSTKLEHLLPEMGMPLAFGPGADFSSMTDAGLWISQVGHKAFLEVNEQGAEAAAATFLDFGCFAAGTPVLTPDGEKPIEQLKAGDYVLSRNEHDVEGKIEPKLVEETFQRHGELIELHVGGQVIRVTKEHPFFVKGQGWTSAVELRPGDLLAADPPRWMDGELVNLHVGGQIIGATKGHRFVAKRQEWTSAGQLQTGDLLMADLPSWMEVEKVTSSGEVGPVYNFRVADHHTYFVGSEAWGFALWTHNGCGGGVFRADHPFHVLIRDNATSALLFMGRISDPSQSENDLTPTVVEHILGDSNGDGLFNQLDIVQVLQAAKYRTAEPATFQEGDWNGDDVFNQWDIVAALQIGNYLKGRYEASSGLVKGSRELDAVDDVFADGRL